MSWPTVALGDYIEVLSGFAFKSDRFNTEGRGLPLVRIRDVLPGRTETFYEGNFDEQFLIKNGDILIGMDGEFNCSRWAGGKALLNQRVCRVTPSNGKLSDGYLFRFLPAALKKIEDKTPFVTVKHLSTKEIRAIEIPLPPVDEQQRIAAILDQADALRLKRQGILDQLNRLKRAIFAELFVRCEDYRWPLKTVADIATSIRTGPFGSQLLHSEFVDDGIAVLGIDNAVNNEFRWNERRFITAEKYRELSRYTVYPRDILITIMGTCGRCAIVPDDIPVAINTKHLCCITLEESVLPQFLHAAFLQHASILRQLGVQAKGAVMPGLNMGIIKSLELRIPPLALQQVFAERIEALDKAVMACRQQADELDALFVSLQHRAFCGEL
jgi:type I restriction enzyme S subunit